MTKFFIVNEHEHPWDGRGPSMGWSGTSIGWLGTILGKKDDHLGLVFNHPWQLSCGANFVSKVVVPNSMSVKHFLLVDFGELMYDKNIG